MPIRVFFDFEFTHLGKYAQPISVGFVNERNHRTLYAEFNDFNRKLCSPFVEEQVLPKLRFAHDGYQPLEIHGQSLFRGDSHEVGHVVRTWLHSLCLQHMPQPGVIEKIEMWGDVVTFDWLLLCDLLGGVQDLPPWLHYIPFDVATLFEACGIDSDISRFEFMDAPRETQHDALQDAALVHFCYMALMEKLGR